MSWVIPWRTDHQSGPLGERRDACALALMSVEDVHPAQVMRDAASWIAWAEDGAEPPDEPAREAAEAVVGTLRGGYVSPFTVTPADCVDAEQMVPDLVRVWEEMLRGDR